jgi:hypothetical protein
LVLLCRIARWRRRVSERSDPGDNGGQTIMDADPIIFAADADSVRRVAAVLRHMGTVDGPVVRRAPAMQRPQPHGAVRRARQVLPRPPVHSRRGG